MPLYKYILYIIISLILHNFQIVLSENEALAVLLDEPRWQTVYESSIVTYRAV